jgi:hypothetical protein
MAGHPAVCVYSPSHGRFAPREREGAPWLWKANKKPAVSGGFDDLDVPAGGLI